jgi:hypothetical protein
MSDSSVVNIIQEQANLLIDAMRQQGVALSYDEKSVEWLDACIETLRHENIRPETRNVLLKSFSCFYGECIRQRCGGQWMEMDGQWGIQLTGSRYVFSPFAKVKQQFESGTEAESVLAFYGLIPFLRDALSSPDAR